MLLTIWTFVSKVMSLLFDTILSTFVFFVVTVVLAAVKWYLTVALICISHMIKGVVLLTICISSLAP